MLWIDGEDCWPPAGGEMQRCPFDVIESVNSGNLVVMPKYDSYYTLIVKRNSRLLFYRHGDRESDVFAVLRLHGNGFF